MHKPFKITLEMGDPSGDGHGHRESVTIDANVDAGDLRVAFETGDYDEDWIEKEYVQKLVEHGYDAGEWLADEDQEAYRTYFTEFFEIYMFICKLGNQGLEWIQTKSEAIYIGGYGLFSN